jgi:hypothetical protein
MSRGFGEYERAILMTLTALPTKREKRYKCRCPRCIEISAAHRLVESNPGRLRYRRDLDNMRRSIRRAAYSLLKKGVIGICEVSGTVQLRNNTGAHSTSEAWRLVTATWHGRPIRGAN